MSLTNGAAAEERLVPSDEVKNLYSWSRHGFLLYSVADAQTDSDLWVVPTSEASQHRRCS